MTQDAATSTEPTEWRLTHLRGASDDLEPVPDTVTVTLIEDNGRLAGNAGCNHYFASGTFDELPTMFATTMMMCPDFVMTVERAYLEALTSCRRLVVDEGTLTGVSEDGMTLLVWTA